MSHDLIATIIRLCNLNLFVFLVALLATVIIWLHDFNNQGVLNMTPKERGDQTKSTLSPVHTSINDANQIDDDNDEDDGSGRQRNKYLSRIGVAGSSSDTEPLLQ